MEEKIGYLIAKTEAQDKKLDHIAGRVDQLWDFKLKSAGVILSVSTICSVIVTLLTLWLRIK